MIQSKLFRAAQLNAEKKTYLHDCKPIICDKSQIISYWESLSLHEKEKIFMVYDLNIIDELVEILNIARTRIASTEFERKSGQIIKMPEKTILLEYLYFDALEIYFKEEFLTKKFIKSLCLIFNKVTNDVYQKYLEDLNIPQCTDSSLIQAKKKVLKFKIKSLISLLDILDVFVDSFCNGEKVIIKKRHYTTLYQQLVKNPLTKNPSSDEIRQKIREITELLSIMLENNLIKAYKKATKYYSKPKKEQQYKNQSSSSSAKVSIIIQHQTNVTNSNQLNSQTEKVKIEGNKENNSSLNITENQTTKEELLQSKKTQQQITPNRNLQEINAEKEEKAAIDQIKTDEQLEVVDKNQSETILVEQNNQTKQQSSNPIQKVSVQETQEVYSSNQLEQEDIGHQNLKEESKKELLSEVENQMTGVNVLSESNMNSTAHELSTKNDITNLTEEKQTLASNSKNGASEIKDEIIDNINIQNKKSQDYQNISLNDIINKQKNECMMEIENYDIYQLEDEEDKYSFSSNKKINKVFQEDGFYHNLNDNKIGSLSSSPQFAKLSQDEIDQDNSDYKKGSQKKRNIKKYLQSEVEPISKKLCMVNLNSLIIKLENDGNNEQSSIFDSDEEYYEPDEKENFHYNQELKDYDIVDVLGDNFKFDPKFCLSKDKINQLLLQSQQQQQQFFTHNTIAPNIQIQQQQPAISSSGKKQLNQNYDYQKSIYSDDSNDESQHNDNFNNKGKYYGHNNQHKGRQQPQQNYLMQDQMNHMMHNFPFQMHTNQYPQMPLYFIFNQNMMNPQQQIPQQNNKYKSSNKHPRNANNNSNSNSMSNQSNSNNHVIHTNPNNLVSSNRKNNQQSSDYHGNQLINNNINHTQNPNSGQYIFSNKGQRNNNNSNSNTNQQSHSTHNSNSGQGFRSKKRFNTKGNNQ
ncbi:hypothetical protein TTHERM_00758820 (macronuclear) [Tetrahymena thermophila SB210]|uniref:Uncharacterized protein n=1 Tax=Tetrahymena thermophila (strain SB210) TaxID=312017 RepID=Q23JM3_TETTS|nr:hypothetical protein TTHERM_00758820 [Tetrahymena thermophila SB210]EAR96720.2 hypothetical protein TTHERM_00758820 [Tetrahymena thermophila SB210]|eukprot:XP_001016965.2 hypothetical protein TTHERM_00758820 [Tetrahymena thermophila SB210]